MEYVVASKIKNYFPEASVTARPEGFLGLVLVENCEKEVLEEIPEIERVLPVYSICRAEIDEITQTVKKVASHFKFGTFAVRCTRRGRHDFTSLDVEREAGKTLSGKVDLEHPEIIFFVEIINQKAFVSALPGNKIMKKYKHKESVTSFLRKIKVVQMPYLNPGAYEMGLRIGRAAQSFEISEVIVGLYQKHPAKDIIEFTAGILRGVRTRYHIQKKTYTRAVETVKISIDDIYRVFMDASARKRAFVIVTDPIGTDFRKVSDELSENVKKADEIYVFIGAREGIPKGIIRKSEYVVDLSPGLTFATELGITASVIFLMSLLK
ncbi:MAG: hypothetical protein GXO63_01610 [Candidatus Micrarchaeota archaeon]|nr:hypothetical protein [Candidatus Micrarchaeota archaeon]